jgi:hypothetical protein
MKPPTIEIDDDGDAEWNTTPLHMVTWTHADEGWAPLPTVFDDFLAAALKGIAAETKPGDANWLFLNFEFGRLMVYPSARDAFE